MLVVRCIYCIVLSQIKILTAIVQHEKLHSVQHGNAIQYPPSIWTIFIYEVYEHIKGFYVLHPTLLH